MNVPRAVIEPAVLAIGLAVSLSPLLWWDELKGIDAWTVAFALWQVLPFAVIAVLHRGARFSAVGTASAAAVVAILTVVGQIAMHRSDSSTAVLGLIWFPIWFVLLVAIAWVVDLAARALVRRFGRRSASLG